MSKRVDALRARRLIGRTAQLVDVLPASIYRQERLPGAVSVPLETMDRSAVSVLDPARAVVVYCFDQH